MVYMDCAATSLQKPRAVSAAVTQAMATMASPGRGCHKPAMLAADTVLNCRMLLADFFNVSDPENVILTFNATHALNIAIHSLVSAGDKVVISGYEHNSVTRPLYAVGADVSVAASPLFDQNGVLEAFRKALPGAKCAVCTHVSNVFGFILPIAEILALCHAQGVPLIIDASQSAGVLPLDFKALDAAFIAMPGHKGLLGPQGTGVLLCNRAAFPVLFGGTGSMSATADMPEFLPDRLEAGTHNVPGAAGLLKSVDYLLRQPKGALFKHEKNLCGAFMRRLNATRGITAFYDETESCQTGVLSLYSEKIGSDLIAEKLGAAGVCVRAGLHCAPTAHETVGTIERGTVRFSFSPFNTLNEVQYVVDTLKKIVNSV